MPTVLIIAGTQMTTSDLHLLYHRAFVDLGWRSVFVSHDSELPFAEKVLQQSHRQFSRLHFTLVNRRVRRVARRERPDLVFVSGSNWYLLPETLRSLRELGARIALNEQHLQVFRPYQSEALSYYDHVFTQDSALIPLLRASSPARSVSLLGPAADPREHRPLELDDVERERFGAQVSYVGTAYPNRVELFESLRELDVRLWGVGWDRSPELAGSFRNEPIHGLKKTKVYNASAINLNLQSVTFQVDGVTCRPFEVAACGAFCLSEPRKDLGSYFCLDSEMVTFRDGGDLKEKIRYYTRHEDERRAIAGRARERVLREHTYEHRVREVLDALGMGG